MADGVVTVSGERLDAAARDRIAAALAGVRGVARVDVVDWTARQTALGPVAPSAEAPRATTAPDAGPLSPRPAGPAAPPPTATAAAATGTTPISPTAEAPPAGAAAAPAVDKMLPTGWLPAGLLFSPLIADPRWPNFSAGYQRYIGDRDFTDVFAASFGETFPFYRGDIGAGQWEIGLQASVFSIFDLDASSFDLINADYFAALPVSHRYGPFSAIGRVFHESSHLGDEFLLRTKVERINLSYEGIDAKLSYDLFGGVVRIYGGAGYLFDRDPSSL